MSADPRDGRAVEIEAEGFRVHPVIRADGGYHVAVVFEPAGDAPGLILHLSAETAAETAGDLLNAIAQAKAATGLGRRQ